MSNRNAQRAFMFQEIKCWKILVDLCVSRPTHTQLRTNISYSGDDMELRSLLQILDYPDRSVTFARLALRTSYFDWSNFVPRTIGFDR